MNSFVNSKYVCQQCGKPFSVCAEDYGYKYRNKKFCSYSCYRAYMRKIGAYKDSEKLLESIKRYNEAVEEIENRKITKITSATQKEMQKLFNSTRLKTLAIKE